MIREKVENACEWFFSAYPETSVKIHVFTSYPWFRVAIKLMFRAWASPLCRGKYFDDDNVARNHNQIALFILDFSDVNQWSFTLFHELIHDQQHNSLEHSIYHNKVDRENDPIEMIADSVANELSYLYNNDLPPLKRKSIPEPGIFTLALKLGRECKGFKLHSY